MPSSLCKLFVRRSKNDPRRSEPLRISVRGPFATEDEEGELRSLINSHGGIALMPESTAVPDIVLVTYGFKKATETAQENARIGRVTLDSTWVRECIEQNILLDQQHNWGTYFSIPVDEPLPMTMLDDGQPIEKLDEDVQMDIDLPSVDNNSNASDSDISFETCPGGNATSIHAHANAASSTHPYQWMPRVAGQHASNRAGTAPPAFFTGSDLLEHTEQTTALGDFVIERPANYPFDAEVMPHQPDRSLTPHAGPSQVDRAGQGAPSNSFVDSLPQRLGTDPASLLFTDIDGSGAYTRKKMHVLALEPFQDSQRDILIQMIENYGGLHVDVNEAETIFINPNHKVTIDDGCPGLRDLHKQLLLSTWISDCCDQGQLLAPDAYSADRLFPELRPLTPPADIGKGKGTAYHVSRASDNVEAQPLSPASTVSSTKTSSGNGKKTRVSREELRLIAQYEVSEPRKWSVKPQQYWQTFVHIHNSERTATALVGLRNQYDREIQDLKQEITNPPLPRLRSRKRASEAGPQDEEMHMNPLEAAQAEGPTMPTPNGPCDACGTTRPCVISLNRNITDPQLSPCDYCREKRKSCARGA